MELTFISTNTQKTYQVSWVEFITIDGSIIIQSGHAPTILILKKNSPILFMDQNNLQESMIAAGGVVEILRSRVIVLLDATL